VTPTPAVGAPEPVTPVASNLAVKPGDGGSLVLRWMGSVGRFEIRRAVEDGEFVLLKTTSDTWFEDRAVESGKSYRYSVTPVGIGGPGTPVEVGPVPAPVPADMRVPVVSATPGAGKVRLRWDKAALGVKGFHVYRSSAQAGPWESINDDEPVPADGWSGHMFVTAAEPGKSIYYRVAPIDKHGVEGKPSDPVSCSALPKGDLGLILSFDFDGSIPAGSWGGVSAYEPVNGVPAAHFTNGNYVMVPDRPEFSPADEITIEMWVKLEKPGVIPVILSHGLWSVNGYFVQILGGQVRFFLDGVGTVDAGSVVAGKWYHIGCTYDGYEMAVYLNGQRVGRLLAGGQMSGSQFSLYIGRYEYPGPEFETDCRMTAVRLYSTALSSVEVKAEFARLAEKLQ
jgi:hypothetical protein